MEPEAERVTAEMRKLNAETAKLEAEAHKLEAEAWKFRLTVVMDGVTVVLAVFAAGIAALTLAERLDWLQEATMLERHQVLRSGFRVDRPWWYATKLIAAIVAALVAAYVVHATLL